MFFLNVKEIVNAGSLRADQTTVVLKKKLHTLLEIQLRNHPMFWIICKIYFYSVAKMRTNSKGISKTVKVTKMVKLEKSCTLKGSILCY